MAVYNFLLRFKNAHANELSQRPLGRLWVSPVWGEATESVVPAEQHESKNELLRSAQAEAFLLPCPRKVLELCKRIILRQDRNVKESGFGQSVCVCLSYCIFFGVLSRA